MSDDETKDDASTAVLERMTTALEAMQKSDEAREADTERRVSDAVAEALKAQEPTTPSRREEGRIEERGLTEIEQMWADSDPELERMSVEHRNLRLRTYYELAMMMYGGTWRLSSNPTRLTPSLEFARGWKNQIFDRGEAPIVADGDGNPIIDANGQKRRLSPQPIIEAIENSRAMDAQETGFGLELIGAQYVRDLWQAARNLDSLVSDIRTIPMTDPTVYVPINGALPEMLFVSESTSASAANYATSKTASNRISLTAKKFTIQQIWSGEMDEDSIIPFTPFLREMLAMSSAMHLGSAYYNGDTTNAGTGNINLDDADPADTKHYLAWDGIRHYWLVDTTGQGKSMAGALDTAEVTKARGKLNGSDDDIDAAVGNINWGTSVRDLRMVTDWDTYMSLLQTDAVRTVDKYGPQATVLTGELGSFEGIPIISPSYATKTEADGKASTTEASNTKGQITVMAPRGFLGGTRREVQFFFDRIQRTDQFLIELYTRRAFTKFGENVAAGIYNITV
jgi:hypothetical protein